MGGLSLGVKVELIRVVREQVMEYLGGAQY